MIFAFIVVIVIVGALYASYEKTLTGTHHGIYISVMTDQFTNSSGSWTFVTSVKNTGTVFIDTVTISIPTMGYRIGILSSISVGTTVSHTFNINRLTNGTPYGIEYYAVSGNLTYSPIYPVVA